MYDHSVRIPMVIKGPGIAAGSVFDFPASNVDVAPTLLGLAGIDELSATMDGRSVLPMLMKAEDPAVLPASLTDNSVTTLLTENLLVDTDG